MDDRETKNTTNEDDKGGQEANNKIVSEKKQTEQEDAGPSSIQHLPGAIPLKSNLLLKPGLSKSEHSIRQIITRKDVANALNLTSLSFGKQVQAIKGLNLKDLKIPDVPKEISDKEDSTTLIDLKKFMASCFKVNKDVPIAVNEVQNAHAAISTITNEVVPNTSCVINTQTENLENVVKTNEVIVTGQPVVEQKVSKVGAKNEKKHSGSLSGKSEFALANRDSLSSIGSNVCRICMTKGRERLISPCNCKGSLANVHLSCLERWLNQVGRNHCELCGFSYPAIRTPRYTVLQALRLWFGNPRNRSHLQSDCLIFWLLSTVTAGLLAVCIVGTQYFVLEGNKLGKTQHSFAARKEEERSETFASWSNDNMSLSVPDPDIYIYVLEKFGGPLRSISHRITETAMDFFMAIVLCGYFVTVYLLWKDHYVMWNRWRRTNVNVRLLLTPDSNPVPFVPRPRYNVV